MGFLPKISIKIADTHIIADCTNKEDVVNIIEREYRENSEVCIGEMLNVTEISGLSAQDVVDVVAKVMYNIEGDEFVQIINADTGESCKEERWKW